MYGATETLMFIIICTSTSWRKATFELLGANFRINNRLGVVGGRIVVQTYIRTYVYEYVQCLKL